jgi:hypothetical protein
VIRRSDLVNIISRQDLRTLSEEKDGWHVSIFMPTHQAGSEIQQDPIRLKNLVREAMQLLAEAGLRSPEAEELLEPASSLVQDGQFWQHQRGGLAMFLSAEIAHHYRLPFDLEQLVVVADRFHVKPLLPLLSGDGQFYVLAFSKEDVRLLQGSRYRVAKVDLESVPTSLADALRFDDPERRLQFHTASGPSGGEGSRPAMFYGQGAPSNDEKANLLRYFHKLDKGVQELLASEQAPLVLAAVDYLLPIYQEANSYPYLVKEGIEGNPDKLSNQELHQKAWAIVGPRFQRERKDATERFRQLADTDAASDNLVEIVPAAYHGRVDTLFVALYRQRWGTFDPATNEVQLRQDAKPGDQDLLDTAAVQTLLNGGAVYAVEPEQMPSGESGAALFRY